MNTLFEYSDYKKWLLDRLQTLPRRGRGHLKKMADYVGVPQSTFSQVFKGDRHLTIEQACMVGRFLGLKTTEEDYFILLVERDRAGINALREIYDRRIERIKKDSLQIANRLPPTQTLSAAEKVEFYSSWIYAAIRIYTSIPGYQDANSIAEGLDLPIDVVHLGLDLLLRTGLVIQKDDGFHVGVKSTHVPAGDPLVFRHHLNWRQKTIELLGNMPKLGKQEFCLTMPCSLSHSAMEKIQQELLKCVDQVVPHIDNSKEECMAILNIDFLQVGRRR